jgi:aminoglycoside 6'-N-acetyltransferase
MCCYVYTRLIKMTITFQPLNETHFDLLLKWLQTPHVKAWWDKDVKWTKELIYKKYSCYVKGYKRLVLANKVIKKPMHAFIICADNQAIGYVQAYNVHDFPREDDYAINLPQGCAAIDWYLGEPSSLGKGIGTQALKLFLNTQVPQNFTHVFVDPETANKAAIKVYEKVGFRVVKMENNGELTLMLRSLNSYITT